MIKTVKNIFNKKKTNENNFRWSSISSGEQKKIIKKAVSGSNRLQKELYQRAKSL